MKEVRTSSLQSCGEEMTDAGSSLAIYTHDAQDLIMNVSAANLSASYQTYHDIWLCLSSLHMMLAKSCQAELRSSFQSTPWLLIVSSMKGSFEVLTSH